MLSVRALTQATSPLGEVIRRTGLHPAGTAPITELAGSCVALATSTNQNRAFGVARALSCNLRWRRAAHRRPAIRGGCDLAGGVQEPIVLREREGYGSSANRNLANDGATVETRCPRLAQVPQR
jgi:hypothetical protein